MIIITYYEALSALYFYLEKGFYIDGINTWQYFLKISKEGYIAGHVEYCRLPSSNALLYSENGEPVSFCVVSDLY
jgi:hypothetical protein